MGTPRFGLRDGRHVTVRPLRHDDRQPLADAAERLSADARFQRFHTALPRLSDRMLTSLIEIDHDRHEALVALPAGDAGSGARPIVGVARYVRDQECREVAELAIVVADEWQRCGLGTLLLRQLAQRARAAGVSRFTAEILADNGPTLDLVGRLGAVDLTRGGDTVIARMDAATWPDEEAPDARRLLRTIAETNVVLLPRVIRAVVDVSAELTRTLVVPVAAVLGWPGRTGEGDRPADDGR